MNSKILFLLFAITLATGSQASWLRRIGRSRFVRHVTRHALHAGLHAALGFYGDEKQNEAYEMSLRKMMADMGDNFGEEEARMIIMDMATILEKDAEQAEKKNDVAQVKDEDEKLDGEIDDETKKLLDAIRDF